MDFKLVLPWLYAIKKGQHVIVLSGNIDKDFRKSMLEKKWSVGARGPPVMIRPVEYLRPYQMTPNELFETIFSKYLLK